MPIQRIPEDAPVATTVEDLRHFLEKHSAITALRVIAITGVKDDPDSGIIISHADEIRHCVQFSSGTIELESAFRMLMVNPSIFFGGFGADEHGVRFLAFHGAAHATTSRRI